MDGSTSPRRQEKFDGITIDDLHVVGPCNDVPALAS